MSINLPTQKIKATKKNPRLLLIYGDPKVGKTPMAAALANSLILDIEDGSDFVDACKIKVNDINHLDQIRNEIVKQNRPYKYIFVDTATELEVWAEAWGTHLYKESSVGKNFKGESVLLLPNGAGYLWLRIAYAKLIDIIRDMAEHIILIAHVKDKMLVDKKGHEVSVADLDLTGKLKAITCSKADAVGYVYRKLVGTEGGKPVEEIFISFKSSGVVAGARSNHISGKEFSMSKVVGEGEEIIVDWDKIFVKEDE